MDSKIKTIILCGGRGTRLNEQTELVPKPMVKIGEKPILWHIMKIYTRYGFNDFILALGYRGNQIKDYFLKRKFYESDFFLNTKRGEVSNFCANPGMVNDDFNIVFAETGLETPHGERVLKLKKYIGDDELFMVTYGDGVADIDINKLIEFHKIKGVIGTITGVHPISRWGMLKMDENDFVLNFAQKPSLYDYANGGFMVFNKKFFDYLKPGYMIEDAFPELTKEKQLAIFKHEGFWYGMDTYRDYLFLNQEWKKDPKWKIWT